MTWETAELINAFRLTVPAMTDVTDAELESDIESYRDYISEKVFGRLFPKALAYFIAHMRTINGMIGSAVSTGGNAGNPNLTVGSITSAKEGDLQLTFSAGSSSSGGSDSDKLLKKTLYGQMFLQLKEMVVVTGLVRRGKRRCFI